MERKLIEYLPPFVQEYREMKAIMQTEQSEFEFVWEAAEGALADQFILQSGINGVKRWEKIFGIIPKTTDTLEERRFRILSKVNEQPPYTLEALRNVLNALCGTDGYTLYLDVEKLELTVKLALKNANNYASVVSLLDRILPANIARITSMYNTYSILGTYSHEQLTAYTHDELRKEVVK